LLFIEFSPPKTAAATHKQHQLLPGTRKLFSDKLSQALTRVRTQLQTHFLAKKHRQAGRQSVSQSVSQVCDTDKRPDMMRSATKYSAKSTAATQNEVNHENCTGGSNFSF